MCIMRRQSLNIPRVHPLASQDIHSPFLGLWRQVASRTCLDSNSPRLNRLFPSTPSLPGKSQAFLLTVIVGGFWMLLEWGLIVPAPSRKPKITEKPIFLIFGKFIRNLEKSQHLGPPNPFFHGEITVRKKCEHNQPPHTIRFNSIHNMENLWIKQAKSLLYAIMMDCWTCPQLSCTEFSKWVELSHWLTYFSAAQGHVPTTVITDKSGPKMY